MQQITITIKNNENVGYLDQDQVSNIQEIVTALITSGGLTGVKGGKTIIHFDGEARFMGVQLDYWPFRRRKL
jgi:hypothetical protein